VQKQTKSEKWGLRDAQMMKKQKKKKEKKIKKNRSNQNKDTTKLVQKRGPKKQANALL